MTDGVTDRPTDRHKDKGDFIGCCPKNVKHPTKECSFPLGHHIFQRGSFLVVI